MKDVIKVTIDQSQVDRLTKARDEIERMPRVIARLLEEVSDRLADREERFWQSLHELTNTSRRTHSIQANWITRTITATPIEMDQTDE
jgi:effector-binding domain-containing protein